MTQLQTPMIAEPWRALGNIADEIVAHLERPHTRQVERACESKDRSTFALLAATAEQRLP